MRLSRPNTVRSAEAGGEAVRSDEDAGDAASAPAAEPLGSSGWAPYDLRRQERAENFPVALRLLPERYRTPLRHLYDVARTIDDLGDRAPWTPEDRIAALQAFRADLSMIWHGVTPHPEVAVAEAEQPLLAPDGPLRTSWREGVLRNLAGTVRSCALPEQPFLDLIEANLRDQTKTAYATYDELLDYCQLSANPVGRLVLDIFGVRTPERTRLSDLVCTALQIIEHCQDVAEDHRAGRRYLPQDDLDRFGVGPADFEAATASPALRQLVRFEAERAEALLVEGAALLNHLTGWARLAIAGYVAGGRAAVIALRRADWAVLPQHPPRRRRDVLAALVGFWARSRRPQPPIGRPGEQA